MSEYILAGIKECLSIMDEQNEFDEELKIFINSALMTLNQLGIGPEYPFLVTSGEEVWSDFVESSNYETYKQYIYICVKLVFDPPQSSYVLAAMERYKTEAEWRLIVQYNEERRKQLEEDESGDSNGTDGTNPDTEEPT